MASASSSSTATPIIAPSVAAALTSTVTSVGASPSSSPLSIGGVSPSSFYYRSPAAPATPLWSAPHPTETLISLICRPISSSGNDT
jgi:hypothetical protein